MKIQTKITLLLSGLVTIFMVGFFVLKVYENKRTDIFYSDLRSEKQMNFDNLLGMKYKTLNTFAYDYSYWDEMLRFVRTKDKEWALHNIDEVFPTFQADAAWVYGIDYSLIYSHNRFNDDSLNEVLDKKRLRQLFSRGYFQHFFEKTPRGLMEICTGPIQPSDDNERKTPPQGFFLVGRLWTGTYLAELSTMTASDIKLVPASKLLIGGHKIEFYRNLSGWDGAPLMAVNLTNEEGLVKELSDLSVKNYMLMQVFAASILFFLYTSLRKWVSVPLETISTSLNTEDASLIREMKGDKSEIGQIAGMIDAFFTQKKALVQEVSERVRAEESLHIFANAVKTMQLGVTISDINGVIIYTNAAEARMHGYTEEEMIGMEARRLGPKETWRPMTLEFLKNFQSLKRDSLNIRKDGTVFPVYLLSDIIRDQNGVPIALVTTSEDISEKKIMEDEHARLESFAAAVNVMNNIGYVFSGIRHEIGNPVNSLKLILEILKNKLDEFPKETVREHIIRAQSALGRVEYILSSLKNYNIYESLDLKEVSISDFMEKLLALASDDFTRKGIVVDVDISAGTAALADPRALQQVMLNIITNSMDALEGVSEPRIHISASKLKDSVRICVKDNGCGVQDPKNLFRPFFTSKPGGTGLGLVITKNMLTKMGGTIDIGSAGETGTLVTITLPEGRTDAS